MYKDTSSAIYICSAETSENSSKCYLITKCFLLGEIKGLYNGILLLQLLVELIKLSKSSIDVPLVIFYANVYL